MHVAVHLGQLAHDHLDPPIAGVAGDGLIAGGRKQAWQLNYPTGFPRSSWGEGAEIQARNGPGPRHSEDGSQGGNRKTREDPQTHSHSPTIGFNPS